MNSPFDFRIFQDSSDENFRQVTHEGSRGNGIKSRPVTRIVSVSPPKQYAKVSCVPVPIQTITVEMSDVRWTYVHTEPE